MCVSAADKGVFRGEGEVDAGDIANLKSLHLSVTRQVAITIKFYSMLHFMRTNERTNERAAKEIELSGNA